MEQTPFAQLLSSLTEDRVAAIVKSLVVAHQNGSLTPQQAMTGIGSIAALRALPEDLARRIRNTQ